jgi:hypothetical protein
MPAAITHPHTRATADARAHAHTKLPLRPPSAHGQMSPAPTDTQTSKHTLLLTWLLPLVGWLAPRPQLPALPGRHACCHHAPTHTRNCTRARAHAPMHRRNCSRTRRTCATAAAPTKRTQGNCALNSQQPKPANTHNIYVTNKHVSLLT